MKKIYSIKKMVLMAVATCTLSFGTLSAVQAKNLRFSYLGKPGSAQDTFVKTLAKQVGEATEGRVKIDTYPASQLGDWTEVQELVMQGAVDFSLQPMSTKFDKSVALAWFPYAVTDYKTAETAFSEGGYINDIVNESSKKLGLTILGAYPHGMGGSGFVKAVPNPTSTEGSKNLKVRVWPGGTTHQKLLERLGYQTAPISWSELYTSLQTGVVDGAIGGTASDQVDSFLDITHTWIQYNDHFELGWIFANTQVFEGLSEADQKTFKKILSELTKKRYAEVEAYDKANIEKLRKQGVHIVEFTPEQMADIVGVVRKDVWPQIADEIGEASYNMLLEKVK